MDFCSMMVMYLLIPFIMVVFGTYFIKNAPKEINDIFGYRTSMSKKNKDTWEFAHHYCGKVWLKIGSIMLGLSVIIMLFVVGKNENVAGSFGGILCFIQVIALIVSIFFTEKALKSNFDEYGNRK